MAMSLETHCMCALVRKVSRSLTSLYDQMLAPSGLRVTQYSLLVNIRRQGTATPSKLSRILLMDKTTLTRNLTLLEKNGLIFIRPGRDGRVKEIGLSEKGTMALDRARPLWENVQSYVGDRMGVSGAEELMERLNGLLHDLEGKPASEGSKTVGGPPGE